MRSLLLALPVLLFSLATASADRVELLAGGGTAAGDAPPAEVRLKEPFGVEFGPDGAMWIAEMASSNRLLRAMPGGKLQVVAGSGGKGFAGDGGPLAGAAFNGMHNLAIARNGDVYLADTWNFRVRKIDAKTGEISTFAGTGEKKFAGDGGPAAEASFGSVMQIALSPDDASLFVTDLDFRRIRRIDMHSGLLTTVAGNGAKGVPADGALATEAPLVDPRAVVADAAGGLYILERGGHALRHVTPEGRIRTVAGTGKAGNSGDGGPALEATLNGPKHLCLDRDGTVLIADAENNVIRRYDPKSGIISRVAGTGRKGSDGLGGPALDAQLARPHGVTIAPDGALVITDSYNDRILRVQQ